MACSPSPTGYLSTLVKVVGGISYLYDPFAEDGLISSMQVCRRAIEYFLVRT